MCCVSLAMELEAAQQRRERDLLNVFVSILLPIPVDSILPLHARLTVEDERFDGKTDPCNVTIIQAVHEIAITLSTKTTKPATGVNQPSERSVTPKAKAKLETRQRKWHGSE
jgi:hypothetical protein